MICSTERFVHLSAQPVLSCSVIGRRDNRTMPSDITPFKGRTATSSTPTRLLRRFVKPGHHAEIRERTVASFRAIEFIVFVDGSLLESQMFHGSRLSEYAPAMEVRARRFADEGWLQMPLSNREP